MNKLRRKSNYPADNLNPSNFYLPQWPGSGLIMRLAALFVISLTLNIGLAKAASSSSDYLLQVKVKNHRCPACFKTLQKYLLSMKKVKAVTIEDGGSAKKVALVSVRVRGRNTAAAVIDRIKAHDLEVLDEHLQVTGSVKNYR